MDKVFDRTVVNSIRGRYTKRSLLDLIQEQARLDIRELLYQIDALDELGYQTALRLKEVVAENKHLRELLDKQAYFIATGKRQL